MTLDYQPPLNHDPTPNILRTATRPLHLIAVGVLLIIVSIKIPIGGVMWDLFDDTLGAILCAIGVFKLAPLPVPGRYHTLMNLVKVAAILQILYTIDMHLTYDEPDFVNYVRLAASIFIVIAAVLFCVAMRMLSLHAGLSKPARSWRLTAILFALMYALPLALVYFAFALLPAEKISEAFSRLLSLLPFHVLLLTLAILAFLPLIHFAISTHRLRRSLKAPRPA